MICVHNNRALGGLVNSSQYILLIEDDLDISEAIQSILEAEGFSIKCKFNGKEAIDYLENSATILPSLILLDLMMPVMNGYDFRVEQLKNNKLAYIPTILLSAAGKYQDIDKLNFNESLKKPIDLDALIDVVKRNIKG